jgi:hypothetical protein
VDVKLLVAEWGESGCIEPPARVQVCHDEEHVIDDDAANLHRFTLSTSGLGRACREVTRVRMAVPAGLLGSIEWGDASP